jgi:hypothetical protein
MRNGLLAIAGFLAVPIAAQAVTDPTRIGPADGNSDSSAPASPSRPPAAGSTGW